jgi:hypothetical protein
VQGVGVVGHHVLVERRHLRLAAPYGYAHCEYFILDTRSGKMRAVARSNPGAVRVARETIRGNEVTRTSRSCLG